MTIVRARVPARRTRELLASAFGAVLLLLALTLPAAGAPIGPTKLESPIVEPRTADTATPVTFTVTYRNAHALPPDYVRVAVAGTTYAMSGAGSDWKAGVVFTVSTVLPAGTHAVRFEARDAERFIDALESGSVVVGLGPTQTPTPTTTPPPAPTPTPPPPTPIPTPTPPPPTPTPPPPPASIPTPTPPPSPAPTAAPQPTPTPTQASTPAPTPTAAAAGTGTLVGPGSTGGAGSGGSGSGGSSSGSGGPGDGNGSGSGTGTGPGSGAGTGVWIEGSGDWTPGRDGSSAGSGNSTSGSGSATSGTGEGPLLPWFTATGDPSTTEGPTGGRGGASTSTRDPIDALNGWLTGPFDAGLGALGVPTGGRLPTIPVAVGSSAAVATWMAFMLFSKRRRDAEPIAPDDVLQASAATSYAVASVPLPVAPVDPEAAMPRWRRPSLLEARRTDPIRSPSAPRPRLAFGSGPGEQGTRAERRVIRYAFSPLLDRPDEIRAERIGELVAGDEVEVQERSGAYLLVLCPDGRQGWVHRMTLGDSAASASATGWAGDSAVEPEAENALAALLAARGMR